MITGQSMEADVLPIDASPGLADWLSEQDVSLAFSTYKLGKLMMVGVDSVGELSLSDGQFDRVTGVAFDDQCLYVATQDQLWQLIGVPQGHKSADDFERRYVPHVGQFTGDLGIRDVAVNGEGHPVFISSRFNCLATLSESHNFRPLWRPRFINRLVGEDRCHLNGVAIVDGKPRFVTACSQTNYFHGWRKCRGDGGVVIDTETDDVIVYSLSMPHSPRWYRQKLWLLNAGLGSFGFVDERTQLFEHVAFCPGFARGLAFTGDFAVIGLSQSRHDPTFEGLPLKDRLADANAIVRRGLIIIDLRSGEIVEWLWTNDPIEEIFEVVVLPGIKQASVTGLNSRLEAGLICPEPLRSRLSRLW